MDTPPVRGAALRARRHADVYTSAEVAALAGVSYRQVDYWVRAGLLRTVSPRSRGRASSRRFHPVEVNVARVVAALHAVGVGEGRRRTVTRSAAS